MFNIYRYTSAYNYIYIYTFFIVVRNVILVPLDEQYRVNEKVVIYRSNYVCF